MKVRLPGLIVTSVIAIMLSAANAATLPRSLPDLDLRTSGYVSTVELQPDGKLIIAGNFSEIGDAGASMLARIGVDGSLDTSWAPQSRYPINALALSDNGSLYVGNTFGGVVKIPLTGSGALDAGFDDPDGFDVADAIVVEGDYIYVATAGELRRYSSATGARDNAWIGDERASTLLSDHAGHLYTGATRVNILDGSVDATWTAPTDGGIHAAALSSDGYLYVASYFDIGGIVGGLARFPLSAHGAPDAAWQPAASGGASATYVRALLPADDGSVFVGGEFAAIGGLARANIARLIGPTGAADPRWLADTDGLVSLLSHAPDGAIIVGGSFTQISTASRASIARIGNDGAPDTMLAAGVYYEAAVTALVLDPASGRLYVGGRFDWVGAERHHNLLRLDATGSLDAAWVPDVSTPPPVIGTSIAGMGVGAIAVVGSYVYVGGSFSSVGGVARNALARVDAAAPGRLDFSWDPALRGQYNDATSPASFVDSMIVDDLGRLIVGGNFESVGSSDAAMIARFNAEGAVDAWRPAISYPVARIADDHAGSLYVITRDPQFGDSTPHKVSASTGDTDPAWDQAASLEAAFDVVVGEADDLFVAGGRDAANTRVLKVSRATGAVDESWTPITNCFVGSLAIDGTYLYAAGYDFSGENYRACVQRIDASGMLDPMFAPDWRDLSDALSLAVGGDGIYVGGIFDHVGDVARRGLAAFDRIDTVFSDGFDE